MSESPLQRIIDGLAQIKNAGKDNRPGRIIVSMFFHDDLAGRKSIMGIPVEYSAGMSLLAQVRRRDGSELLRITRGVT